MKGRSNALGYKHSPEALNKLRENQLNKIHFNPFFYINIKYKKGKEDKEQATSFFFNLFNNK